jgi:hypothetical protein
MAILFLKSKAYLQSVFTGLLSLFPSLSSMVFAIVEKTQHFRGKHFETFFSDNTYLRYQSDVLANNHGGAIWQ